MRNKNVSLYTKPLRIPYLTKENAVDPSHDDLNSFVTKDPLFMGKQKEIDSSFRNRNDSAGLF